jgi:protein AroM
LIEPQRIIPPLVASIVDGHQVGVIVPIPELMEQQQRKWSVLEKTPFYTLAHPYRRLSINWFRRERTY